MYNIVIKSVLLMWHKHRNANRTVGKLYCCSPQNPPIHTLLHPSSFHRHIHPPPGVYLSSIVCSCCRSFSRFSPIFSSSWLSRSNSTLCCCTLNFSDTSSCKHKHMHTYSLQHTSTLQSALWAWPDSHLPQRDQRPLVDGGLLLQLLVLAFCLLGSDHRLL